MQPASPPAQGAATPASPKVELIVGAVFGVVVLLLLHRYTGIYHDALLYMAQGMKARWPGLFATDLFFLHGNQDRYSAFPWLLGHAFGLGAPPRVMPWGSLLSLLSFAAASWYCLRVMLPERQRYWSWLAVLCLPSFYGIVAVFSYNEAFLTPRPFAEALCLVGIGLLARGRLASAAMCALVAAMLHPLQAIAAGLVAWAWLVGRDRRWMHAAWLVLPTLALAWAGIAPLDGLLQRIDDDWLTELRNSSQLFVSAWVPNDYKVLLFDILVLSYAWKALDARFAAWCRSALVGLGLGLLTSLVLVDLMQLVLPAALQLWRVHWLAHWFSVAALGAILFRDHKASHGSRAMILALTTQLAWGESAWGWLLPAMLYACWPRISGLVGLRMSRLIGCLFGLALALLFLQHAAGELRAFDQAGRRLAIYPLDRGLLAFPTLAFGLALLGVWLWDTAAGRHGCKARMALAVLLLLPLTAFAARAWDARSPAFRAIESAAFRTDIFGIDLPAGAQVYWNPELMTGPWLVLLRPSYFSNSQLSGQMFDRGTALDGRIRESRLLPLARESLGCQQPNAPADCHISHAAMQAACGPGQDAGPDYLVLPYRQPEQEAGEWQLRNPDTGEDLIRYRLYDCKRVVTGPTVSTRGVAGP